LLGVAEETGLSITLGRQTMDTVCRQLRAWSKDASPRELTLALNLTERQFYHPDMIQQLERALELNQVDPARLLFEVGESTLNENQDAAADILKRMAHCGVRLAVDNFGARFAPLSHLAHLPLNVVKFAPKLAGWATSTGREVAVLESLIQLGHALGMQIVAQGIETPEQLEALSGMG
jgi:EAL domain-containing protein (putative c-di-GMP-specific phosphodiesterase class I)